MIAGLPISLSEGSVYKSALYHSKALLELPRVLQVSFANQQGLLLIIRRKLSVANSERGVCWWLPISSEVC